MFPGFNSDEGGLGGGAIGDDVIAADIGDDVIDGDDVIEVDDVIGFRLAGRGGNGGGSSGIPENDVTRLTTVACEI